MYNILLNNKNKIKNDCFLVATMLLYTCLLWQKIAQNIKVLANL